MKRIIFVLLSIFIINTSLAITTRSKSRKRKREQAKKKKTKKPEHPEVKAFRQFAKRRKKKGKQREEKGSTNLKTKISNKDLTELWGNINAMPPELQDYISKFIIDTVSTSPHKTLQIINALPQMLWRFARPLFETQLRQETIWKVQPTFEFLGYTDNEVNQITVSPDGSYLAAFDITYPANHICLFNLKKPELPERIFKAHTEIVNAVCFSADSNKLLTASDDKTLLIWDFTQEKYITKLEYNNPVTAIAVSQDGNWLASATSDGYIHFYKQKGNVWKYYTNRNTHENIINQIEFSPDNSFIVSVSDDQNIKIHEYKDSTWILTGGAQSNGPVTWIAISPDSNLVAYRNGLYRSSILHRFKNPETNMMQFKLINNRFRTLRGFTPENKIIWHTNSALRILKRQSDEKNEFMPQEHAFFIDPDNKFDDQIDKGPWIHYQQPYFLKYTYEPTIETSFYKQQKKSMGQLLFCSAIERAIKQKDIKKLQHLNQRLTQLVSKDQRTSAPLFDEYNQRIVNKYISNSIKEAKRRLKKELGL